MPSKSPWTRFKTELSNRISKGSQSVKEGFLPTAERADLNIQSRKVELPLGHTSDMPLPGQPNRAPAMDIESAHALARQNLERLRLQSAKLQEAADLQDAAQAAQGLDGYIQMEKKKPMIRPTGLIDKGYKKY